MTGKYIVPGLIEMHMHGATGYEVADRKEEAIEAIGDFMLKNGVTSFVPTVPAQCFDDMLNSCKMIRNYAEEGIQMCDSKSGKVMGVDGITGSIKEGKCADFLVLDKDYNLCEVYKNGEKVNLV